MPLTVEQVRRWIREELCRDPEAFEEECKETYLASLSQEERDHLERTTLVVREYITRVGEAMAKIQMEAFYAKDGR